MSCAINQQGCPIVKCPLNEGGSSFSGNIVCPVLSAISQTITWWLMTKSVDIELKGVLTEQEALILNHVALGRGNKEIGAELGLAESTIKNHMGAIMRKLNARDRANAVAVALLMDAIIA